MQRANVTTGRQQVQKANIMENLPTVAQATRTWGKIGLLSFGGPAAQIALMHREVVEEKKWLTEPQFLNALNFCMLLPGPEAMQLATYSGWRINGVLGGLVAGLLFVLPGAFVIALLATIYVYAGQVPVVNALFLGVKATVIVIVIEALIRVSKKALKAQSHYLIAIAAFIGIFLFNLPYPIIVICAALYGYFALPNKAETDRVKPTQPWSKTLATILTWLAIWLAPVILVDIVLGHQFLTDIAMFFSKLAVVTFGGAYAVLAYMAQDVVGAKEWLTAGQMMDGLGLAETTPGPLILVTQFVGFLAGYKEAGIAMAFLACGLTLWVTFAPCFLWIFAGAPYIDWIGTQPRLHGALSAITAAVVGVILNLSVWFTIHVFFEKTDVLDFGLAKLIWPEFSTFNFTAALLCALAFWLLLRRHWNVVWVLAINAALAAVVALV
jgi:chromate transporter